MLNHILRDGPKPRPAPLAITKRVRVPVAIRRENVAVMRAHNLDIAPTREIEPLRREELYLPPPNHVDICTANCAVLPKVNRRLNRFSGDPACSTAEGRVLCEGDCVPHVSLPMQEKDRAGTFNFSINFNELWNARFYPWNISANSFRRAG